MRRMQSSIRIAAVLVILVLLASGSASSEQPPVGQAQKLTIAIQQNPNVEDYATNLLTTYIEEGMDADLEFVIMPADGAEMKTKLALWVSSNSTLPDVINTHMTVPDFQDYAKKGVFVDLTDYFNDPSIAVNFRTSGYISAEEQEFILSSIKLDDGRVYSLFDYGVNIWNEAGNRVWINKDWLDVLGLEQARTTDEFYEVLKAFRDGDPNGNGLKDEIPLIGAMNGWNCSPVQPIMSAFINCSPNADYFVVNDGKLSPAFTTEEWLEGLKYMNMLVTEGLLSPLTFTQDQTQLKALATAETATAGVVPAGSFSMFGADPAISLRMTMMQPLTGPKGVSTVPYAKTLPSMIWFITKDCKDPEFAFRVGDFFYTYDNTMRARYGINGEHWSDDPVVLKDYIPSYGEVVGYPVLFVSMLYGAQELWSQPNNVHWQNFTPKYFPEELNYGFSTYHKDNPNLSTNWNLMHMRTYAPKVPEEYVSQFLHTNDELTELADMLIKDYVYTSAVEFITGNRSFDQWDGYLNVLNRMGLERFIELRQIGFDRAK